VLWQHVLLCKVMFLRVPDCGCASCALLQNHRTILSHKILEIFLDYLRTLHFCRKGCVLLRVQSECLLISTPKCKAGVSGATHSIAEFTLEGDSAVRLNSFFCWLTQLSHSVYCCWLKYYNSPYYVQEDT